MELFSDIFKSIGKVDSYWELLLHNGYVIIIVINGWAKQKLTWTDILKL